MEKINLYLAFWKFSFEIFMLKRTNAFPNKCINIYVIKACELITFEKSFGASEAYNLGNKQLRLWNIYATNFKVSSYELMLQWSGTFLYRTLYVVSDSNFTNLRNIFVWNNIDTRIEEVFILYFKNGLILKRRKIYILTCPWYLFKQFYEVSK